MKNKDIEKLFASVTPVVPDEDVKNKILTAAVAVPVICDKPINKFLVFTKRYALSLACLLIVFIAAVTMLGVYNTSYYEVYLDVNPSIEVCVNRFGVISKVKCINEDAKECLKGVKLKGKRPEDAVEDIAYILDQSGYFNDRSELFVSGYSEEYGEVDKTVEALYYLLTDIAEQKGYSVQVFTGEFTKEEKDAAKKEGISPLKYSIISELISLDDRYGIQELSARSMGELNDAYIELKSALSQEVIDSAAALKITPMRYQFIEALKEYGYDFSSLIGYDTAGLEELYDAKKQEYQVLLEITLKQKAAENGVSLEVYRTVYNIMQLDKNYDTPEKEKELLKKSLFELEALEFALEKYDVIKDLFD